MTRRLAIYDSGERRLVAAADLVVDAYGGLTRLVRRSANGVRPRRILLLRLERIGDLLMTLGAIDAVRRRAPEATIHLVVGGWNASLARLVTSVNTVETLDVPWLARGASGDSGSALARRAWAWRAQRFDLAINFEPDIRSNGLLNLSGATRRVGFSSGGGAGFLTDVLDHDPAIHTAANAQRVVDLALPQDANDSSLRFPRLSLPEPVQQQAAQLLSAVGNRVLVGVHASGGRAIKQWPVERFAEVAARLSRERNAVIVLTGTPEDRPLVDALARALPRETTTIDVAGAIELPVLAALLERLHLFVTADTGPMHLAAAVGAPVVAIFGPSDPVRYGPLTDRARVVTTELWCRPCNRIRRPPERCVGRVPDCLNGVDVGAVYRAAIDLLKSG